MSRHVAPQPLRPVNGIYVRNVLISHVSNRPSSRTGGCCSFVELRAESSNCSTNGPQESIVGLDAYGAEALLQILAKLRIPFLRHYTWPIRGCTLYSQIQRFQYLKCSKEALCLPNPMH